LRSASAWQQVDRFFRDVIELETDVSALVGRAQAMVTRVSGGLAHWARQLDFSPYRLHVEGTAGSGKTQLALAEFRGAIDRGLRPLYVCYNRPLADHVARIAPHGGDIVTYPQLGDRVARSLGQRPDFSQPGAFARLEETMDAWQPDDASRVDVLIVDEGQDFHAAWLPLLARQAARLGTKAQILQHGQLFVQREALRQVADLGAGLLGLFEHVVAADPDGGWAGLFAKQWFKLLSMVTFLGLYYHAWVGIRDIWMDYVKNVGLRLTLQFITIFWLVGCVAYTVQILWSV
jgi:succinate dehydrogenase hydrophobic membrane anchor protein